jgi:tetratricopeptide (TPR) repeat protein
MRNVTSVALVVLLCAAAGAFAQSRAADSEFASSSSFSLHVLPALAVPLGDVTPYFDLGGSALILAQYRLPFFQNLAVVGGLGYDYSMLSLPGQSVSVGKAVLGAGMVFPVIPRIVLSAYVTGGYYRAMLNDLSVLRWSGNPCLLAGATVLFRITPVFGIEAGASYQYLGGLSDGLAAYVGTSFNLGKEQLTAGQLAPRAAPLGLSLGDISLDPVFPVFRKYYDDHPVGTVTVKNIVKTPVSDVKINLFIRNYMDVPKKCAEIPTLAAGASQDVNLYALLNESILNVTEATKVAVELTVSYTVEGQSRTDTETETLRVYDRNAMTWDDNRKASAFVTAKEPVILTLSNNINSYVKPVMNKSINRNLQAAMAIHEATRLLGIQYVSNPLNYAETSKNKEIVDTLKFPRQTLLDYHSGDCSDLSILYCALLESMQIPTAFITVPGHIFMAASLGMTPDVARQTFSHPENLIFRNEDTWLPIEITERNSDFLAAWNLGAKEWRENTALQAADFYLLHDGWKVFEPVQLPGTGTAVVPAQEKLLPILSEETQRYVASEIMDRVALLQSKIKQANSSPKSLNDLGVLYARYGLLDNASQQFTQAVARAEFVPALVNLGNVNYLRADLESALTYFSRAYKADKTNATALLGLARVSSEQEDYGTAKRYYDALKQQDANLAKQFAYLELKGEASTRAAEISQLKEVVVWSDK